MGAGIYGMAQGVAGVYAGNKVMGATAIIAGFGGTAFGLAKLISGLHGQTIEQYGGMGEAIDKRLGGNGKMGATLDILSGGKPQTVIDGLLLYKSINDLFKSNGRVMINPNQGIMQQDNTKYVAPLSDIEISPTHFIEAVKLPLLN